MAISRNKMKEQLMQRNEEQNRINSDNVFESYLNIPEGVHRAETKVTAEGADNMFDIVPFYVGSKYPTYPKKFQGKNFSKLNPGDGAYVLNLFIHKGIGPNNQRIVCPNENYGLPCPVCEERDRRLAATKIREERAAIWKEFGTMHRCIYNVIIRDQGEQEAKGVQIFDLPFAWSEEALSKLKVDKRTKALIPYAMYDTTGRTICFNAQKSGESNWEVGSHELLERDYEITDEEIDSAQPLDELVNVLDYEAIKVMVNLKNNVVESTTSTEETNEMPSPAPRRTLRLKAEATPTVKDMECPYGGEFGVKHNDYMECENCNINDDCGLKKEQLLAANKKAAPTPRRRPTLQSSTGDDVPY